MKSPKIVKRTLDYKNPFMNIFREEVLFEDGRKKDHFVVDRKNDFSVVIPIFSDQTVMLVGQYRIPIETYSWEYPMGTVNNKKPLQVAKQELKEETGLTAKKWKKIGESFVAPGYCKQKFHIFIATDLSEGIPEPEPFEMLTSKRVKLLDVKKMIRNGKIKDGPTIVADYFLHEYVNSL